LKLALERLLGGPCCHMSELPGHPFDLGPVWQRALAGGPLDPSEALADFVACADWPASLFWEQISATSPSAPVLLSSRPAAQWLASMEATVLPIARRACARGWDGGRDLVAMFELFTGTVDWDHAEVLLGSFMAHERGVRATCPPERLVEWRPAMGWAPICRALDLEVPPEPFPWVNRRGDWQ
jgi:Sulfotransferase domain